MEVYTRLLRREGRTWKRELQPFMSLYVSRILDSLRKRGSHHVI